MQQRDTTTSAGIVLFALAGLGTAAANAAPTIIEYAARGDLTAAASALDSWDFQDVTLDGSDRNQADSFTKSGLFSDVVFTGTASTGVDLAVLGTSFGVPSSALFSNRNGEPIEASFSTGITAAGFDMGSLFGSSGAVELILRDALGTALLTRNFTADQNLGQFFGFTIEDGLVHSIEFRGTDPGPTANLAGFDNFTWGFTTIPLPTGAAMAAVGLLGLGMHRRRASL
ncbi:MAG: hypothetical protein HND58_15145 [Planctomycetota bacterium]|nr:MAG: hypothetical protein HND58_15145 [Planctomycetota bacterium]